MDVLTHSPDLSQIDDVLKNFRDNVEIKRVSNGGPRGLFATKDYKKDELITLISGIIVDLEKIKDRGKRSPLYFPAIYRQVTYDLYPYKYVIVDVNAASGSDVPDAGLGAWARPPDKTADANAEVCRLDTLGNVTSIREHGAVGLDPTQSVLVVRATRDIESGEEIRLPRDYPVSKIASQLLLKPSEVTNAVFVPDVVATMQHIAFALS